MKNPNDIIHRQHTIIVMIKVRNKKNLPKRKLIIITIIIDLHVMKIVLHQKSAIRHHLIIVIIDDETLNVYFFLFFFVEQTRNFPTLIYVYKKNHPCTCLSNRWDFVIKYKWCNFRYEFIGRRRFVVKSMWTLYEPIWYYESD